MKQPNTIVLIVAILSLVVLELFAMYKNIDGYLFSLIVVAVAGIAGFKLPKVMDYFRKKK